MPANGAHEHPTQALLDMMTIRRGKGQDRRVRGAHIGDIAHSRVARSNIYGLNPEGGPSDRRRTAATMLPRQIEQMGVTVHQHFGGAIKVLYHHELRIQTEREQQEHFPIGFGNIQMPFA